MIELTHAGVEVTTVVDIGGYDLGQIVATANSEEQAAFLIGLADTLKNPSMQLPYLAEEIRDNGWEEDIVTLFDNISSLL